MNIVFVDWDDTIFPTTYFGQLGLLIKDPNSNMYVDVVDWMPLKKEIKQYCISVYFFLYELSQFTKVFILSSSKSKWIKLTKSLIGVKAEELVDTLPILLTDNKVKTMSEAIDEIKFSGMHVNINSVISIGDSISERLALLSLKNTSLFTYYTKSIKFLENPSLRQLIREQGCMCAKFNEILDVERDMDDMIQIREEYDLHPNTKKEEIKKLQKDFSYPNLDYFWD